MKINIIGFSKVDYVNKQGRQVSGSQIFAIGESNYDNTKGQVWVGKRSRNNNNVIVYSPIFVSSSVPGSDRISCGAWDIDFDLDGNVSRMEKIKID